MTARTNARLNIAAGVATLLWIARPVPAIVAWKLGCQDFAAWWLMEISPTLVANDMISPLVWMYLEVPLGLVFGVALISKGLRR